MRFHATNYTVSILLLMCVTFFIAQLRWRKSLENNWPMFYWAFVALLSLKYPEETFDPQIVLAGLAVGALLRLEFIGGWVTKLLKVVELGFFGYIVYMCLLIMATH